MVAHTTETLLNIPTLLWSGIIAAIISLAGAITGVVLSNQSSEKRLSSQLRHDANEKQKERIGLLRREVYLALFEEMLMASGHLGGLAGKDPVTDDLGKPLQGIISQLSKVQLVGGQRTYYFASELSDLYRQALLRLLLAAKPMHELKIDIGIASKNFDSHIAEANRVNREIQSLNESGNPDPKRMKALQLSFEFATEQYERIGAQRADFWNALNSLQVDFMDAAGKETGQIMPVQAKLMAEMRAEIGLTADIDFMLERMEVSQQRMKQATQELLSRLT